ncbi:hypothetical protein NP493_359g01052 [Ridgeia piscesae]|uniref:Vacuolar protein sorting-associated protein 54 n=1 Tax=Ridgeia piscesae TaxID=27915 RepID=A0AAD9NW31_RIDPI|nr:hypothetical protein NP493_359g01052 [Ridgeia piscesae]
MFNSRTCQLILGAGALQLVGLKTITTKNLALASRCLQLTVHFLPLVRQHFADHMPHKQLNMLNHLDHVLKDYKDHIAELANKFVVIMDSMLDASLSKWEVKAPVPSVCFRSLCRQLHKLHEAIVDLLPVSQVLELFERVHASFKLRLRSQLIKLGVTNDGGPQHGLVVADVTFYVSNLKSLSGLGSLDDAMDDIWDKS